MSKGEPCHGLDGHKRAGIEFVQLCVGVFAQSGHGFWGLGAGPKQEMAEPES